MAAETSSPAISVTYDWSYLGRRPSRLRRLGRIAKQQPLGVFGLLVLLMFVFFGVFGPYITPYNPRELSAGPSLAKPSWDHPFGANQLGQDMFSRVIAGTRISLTISVAAIFIGSLSGSFLGVLGGYYGRWVDYLVQRSGEAFAAFPGLTLYLLLIAAFGQGVKTIIIAIAIGALFGGNRVLRGATLVEARALYVEAARAVGCSEKRIFFRHVIPNVMSLTIIIMSGALGAAILAESALAFLGLGVEPGTPSWGIDISANLSLARAGYWPLVVFPGIAISLVVLGANLLGDSLRDVLDPRLRR
jgi:ABC-type dipeptide/oligopeptide/nickel transport system permease subunit